MDVFLYFGFFFLLNASLTTYLELNEIKNKRPLKVEQLKSTTDFCSLQQITHLPFMGPY